MRLAKRWWRAAGLLVATSMAVSCGEDTIENPPPKSDMVAAVVPDMAMAPPPRDLAEPPDLAGTCKGNADCPMERSTCCASRCVDVRVDTDNCGTCGRSCGAGKVCCSGVCADTATDPAHCGACGMKCMTVNGAPACAMGVCTIGMCGGGFGDCNATAADGCEVDVKVSVEHCGKCGNSCKTNHALGECVAGTCGRGACEVGYDDCNNDSTDGCETATSSSKDNCGSCGAVCNGLPNASAVCLMGVCTVDACRGTNLDCDKVNKNGCEVNVQVDVLHCGACGMACDKGLVCRAGMCTCPACSLPNATSSCVNLKCAIDACLKGFVDCDKLPDNGCEIRTDVDPRNCGQCGVVCPKEKPVCSIGVCTNIPPPIIYFDAADANSYPGNGKTWTDLMGSGVQGALVNNITYGTLDGVKTLIFDGAGAGVNFPNATLDDKTFGGVYWVYSKVPMQVADQGGLYVNWTRREWNPPNWVAFFKWNVDDWYWRVNNNGCCQDLPGSGAGGFAKNVPQNQWTMVHFFYQVGTPNGWKWGANGKNVSASTMMARGAGQAEATSVIGWGHPMEGGYWIGGISSVRFYKVLLTDEELATLYAATKGAYGL